MCGIVGYIGEKSAKDILIESLKKLEYRGYDSSGIALFSDFISVYKSVGKIKKLEEKVRGLSFDSSMGIAHTRWATHGKVNLENAHPHQIGKITLVHNGIIENAEEIRKELEEKGVSFSSETDTEVVAAYLNFYYDGDVFLVLSKMMKRFVGSYALGILFSDQKDHVYVVKKESPLVIGLGERENFFASDISAIHSYTNRFIYLEDDDIGMISKEKVSIFHGNKLMDRKVVHLPYSSTFEDHTYDHFMLKEIYEQPKLLKSLFEKYINHFDLLPDLSKYETIHIVGCGSAMYAGMIGKYLLEEFSSCSVLCEVASEYRYRTHRYQKKTLVIGISQSGETADTIAALKLAKEAKCTVLAIVNQENSTIHKLADQSILLEAGEEKAVATTKAYLLQVALLSLLVLKLIHQTSNFEIDLEEIKKIPYLLEMILEKNDCIQEIAYSISSSKNCFFIGRGIDYMMCLEGSLKLKEISYIHSEAYPAGELKHGSISLIEDDFPVFVLGTDSTIYKKTLSNAIEVESRGAKVIKIVTEDICDETALIHLPKVSVFFQPLIVVPVFQLIAYHVALLNQYDIDQPKNLAKSVTVE